MLDLPFDTTGIRRDERGIKRYSTLPTSLVSMLRTSVERDPKAPALVFLDGERLTYRQLWDQAAHVAGGLRDQGFSRGSRIAIRRGNSLEWVLTFFGGLMAGGVVVPVNTRFTDSEAAYVIEDSGAAFVADTDSPLPQGSPLVVDDLSHGDLAAIFYTSGTTGFPKGAMTTHGNFLANAENCIRVRHKPAYEPTARTLISVPLFHVTGCNSQLLPTLQQGGTAVIMPAFDVQAFLKAISDERITVVTAVPAIFWHAVHQPNFLDFDVSSVKYATYGGAPISPALVRQVKECFPQASVANGFGLTETSSLTTLLPDAYALSHSDSVGFPAPTIDLELSSADPRTGVGELLIRGPNVVSGYWNNPTATSATFKDGWVRSGDLARIDDNGFTYIVDRAKDMINRGGENVYCVEVENALAAAPGVSEVTVVGVPDDMMGEKVGAVVVTRPGETFDRDLFMAHARAHLADFKLPQYLVVQEDLLPRNAGGKVLKAQLRECLDWGLPIR